MNENAETVEITCAVTGAAEQLYFFLATNGREGEKQMAIAKQVLDYEATDVVWSKIEDDTGKVWRDDCTEETDLTSLPHVFCGLDEGRLTVKLACRNDGKAVLRQDEPGLPERIIVEILQETFGAPKNLVIGGRQGRFVYVRGEHG